MPGETPRETPGNRLAKARKAAGYQTAADAADTLGVPLGSWHGLENGHRTLTAKRAKELSELLGTTPEYLLYGRGSLSTEGKTMQTVSFFLAVDVSSFRRLREGGYPESQKKIMIDGVVQLPKRLICVEIPDGAMTRDKHPSYPQGAKVFVDPDARPSLEDYRPGDIVLAVVAGNPLGVFRRFTKTLVKAGPSQIVLKAFDPEYQDFVFKPERGDEIIGLVIGSLFIAAT